jgi:drug/metabolite transporter (DMT)-like permease
VHRNIFIECPESAIFLADSPIHFFQSLLRRNRKGESHQRLASMETGDSEDRPAAFRLSRQEQQGYEGPMLPFRLERQTTLIATLPPSVQGALWMSASAALFAVMINLVRHLTDHFDPLQVVFFRNVFGLLAICPWLLRQGLSALHTKRLHLHVFRALFGIAAMVLWFTTLSLMPLAEATALSFTAPIFTSILAIFFLQEVMHRHRCIAIAMGFLGAMIIVRPGLAAMNPVAILAIATALVWGSGTIMLKYMSRTETTSAIVIYLPLFLTPISLVPALIVWQWPSFELWGTAVLFGAVGTAGHLCLTRALTIADATSVMPFDYLRLPFVAIIAYLAFGEQADIWVWLGGGLIAGSAIYMARRESRARSQGATA